jgi:hypothetical protein
VKTLGQGDVPIHVTEGRVRWPVRRIQNVRARESKLDVTGVDERPRKKPSVRERKKNREHEETGKTALPVHEEECIRLVRPVIPARAIGGGCAG